MRGFCASLAALLLAGCISSSDRVRAPETDDEVERARVGWERIAEVGVPLLRANIPICRHLGERCDIRGGVVAGGGFAAFAYRGRIVLNFATLDAIQDKQELAFMVAHEWAHNLVHANRRPGDDRLRMEREADCVGSLLMLRAGYTPTKGALALMTITNVQTAFDRFFGSGEYDPPAERVATVAGIVEQARGRTIDRPLIRQICGVAP